MGMADSNIEAGSGNRKAKNGVHRVAAMRNVRLYSASNVVTAKRFSKRKFSGFNGFRRASGISCNNHQSDDDIQKGEVRSV